MSDTQTYQTLSADVHRDVFILFLVCKLTGVTDWPWVWVLAPLWVPLVLTGLFVCVLVTKKLNARHRRLLAQKNWDDLEMDQ